MVKSLSIRVFVCVLWLIAVGAGFALLLNYQTASGRVGNTPAQWPPSTSLQLDHNRPTLIMFAHPKCPCTQASIEELNRLTAQIPGRVSAHVLLYKPAGFPEGWTKGGLWKDAASIPGVSVEADLEGTQAKIFGAETSGYVLLYDTRGQLLFKGGITAGRGHAGNNAGENAVASLVNGQTTAFQQTPVYGCSILGECTLAPESTRP